MSDDILSGSYLSDDVIFLLKEISGLITEKDNKFREKAIQSGTHYSEMLPIEYHPSQEYMDIFHKTLQESKLKLAVLTGIVSKKIIEKQGKNVVLVSLARAGTPIGILIKRYIKYRYNIELPHYSISIIRDRGIDKNALFYILNNHPERKLQFIDGWTGKGVIQDTLIKACDDFYKQHKIKLNSELAVISDPAYCSAVFGTHEDFLIPSACLNSTVSGLISRTVLNEKFIGEKDFHGAKFYKEWLNIDVSNLFIDTVSQQFSLTDSYLEENEAAATIEDISYKGLASIEKIQKDFNITDINLVKPGVGETTRVLLRRIPWKILVNSYDNPYLQHIYKLAEERNVPVEIYEDMTYSCCGIIKPKELIDV